MKTLEITSVESLEAAVAEAVRSKIEYTKLLAARDLETQLVGKKYQPAITGLAEDIAGAEAVILAYCAANRSQLFPKIKSRETAAAVFGFEFTPWRVEPATKQIKWKDVVARLSRLTWGKAYLRQAPPQPDKDALLADREKLNALQQTAAGICFAQDEQFFLRPKPETAADSTSS